MKKLILILILILSSCSKGELKEEEKPCNCYTIYITAVTNRYTNELVSSEQTGYEEGCFEETNGWVTISVTLEGFYKIEEEKITYCD